MGFLQGKIYPRLPVFAQNWAISVYGYMWRQRRFGGIYKQELRGFIEREGYTAQQWRDYQTLQLRRLLIHAFETVPFYRERYGSLGFTKARFERFELEDISKLPYLSKDELRQFGTTSLLSAKREKGGQFFASSGSTGTPVKILYSHAFHQRMNAAMEARVRHWAGVDGNTPRGMIGGRRILPSAENIPPYFRYNYFERQTYFSAYHISLKNAKNYLQGIEKYGVRYMTGYAMSNYFLASLFEELNLDVPGMQAVITSSEKLTPAMRKTMENVYRCRTYDSYSGVENCGLISESPEAELLVNPDVGFMEFLDSKGLPVSPGEEGEIISTGFLNYDQPLIRYKIGDNAVTALHLIGQEGREMPLIQEISGRTEDGIITKDGRKMVRFHGIFIDLPHVIEGQIIQRDYEYFIINIVAVKGFQQEEENIIRARMKTQVGEASTIEIIQVKEIPRTSNGKFKSVISELIV